MRHSTCLVTGAAGFIGSHLADRLLASGRKVIGIDNLLLGTRANLKQAFKSADFSFIEADVNDFDSILPQLSAHASPGEIDMVWHLAANSDIRAGTLDPEVDLRHTFLSTFNLLKTMRVFVCRRLAFASSSAIYGPHPGFIAEDAGPLQPISNYGAMKLASEGIISAAIETSLDCAWVFRFPNVVGERSTHGVIYDFLRKLRATPRELEVLGDGRQEKPYIHVSELVDAMLFIQQNAQDGLNSFNIGPDASATTVRQIAERVVSKVAPSASIRYTGGTKGWPGDVPAFNYSIEKLRRLGWTPRLTSAQAVHRAIEELIRDDAAG